MCTGLVCWKLCVVDEMNQRSKYIRRHTVFIDWKAQHSNKDFNSSHWYKALAKFLSKFQQAIFLDIYKIILNVLWKGKETGIGKTTSKYKNKVGGLNLLNYKTYIARVINIFWYWWKDKYIDEQNREPRNRITHICQLIYMTKQQEQQKVTAIK